MLAVSEKQRNRQADQLKKQIERSRLPTHVAVIMDGNGRWALRRNLPRIEGHRRGVLRAREAVRTAAELGISYLTLFAFSTENWARPPEEVHSLMDLLVETINEYGEELKENNARLLTIGNLWGLPGRCRTAIEKIKQETSSNTGITVVVAINYSARWEITEAVRRIAGQFTCGRLSSPEQISHNTVAQYLDTAGIPDPDLLVRTSGEFRISNFLLWQLAYTELYFTRVLWPDFDRLEFMKAIVEFQRRERRFGGVPAWQAELYRKQKNRTR